jgi:ribosomal protein L40E
MKSNLCGAGTVLLILSPHPSLLILLVRFYLLTLHAPLRFAAHLLATYTLTFLALSSLLICVVRDPGPTAPADDAGGDEDAGGEGMSLAQALLAPPPPEDDDDDFNSPKKWCRKCWAPKPPRTHHCSLCGRCVLKMGTPLLLLAL